MVKLKPCPKCHDAWIFASVGDYYSDYENYGYRVSCLCGFAWDAIGWYKTKEEAIAAWNAFEAPKGE